MVFSMGRASTLLASTLLCTPLLAQAEELTSHPLFHIERSKNANIVQYDAQVAVDGRLFEKEPIVGYWIRLVVRDGDKFRATVTIDGAPSCFEKMYIDVTRDGLSLDVRYVELFGEDLNTGEARYEKLVS